MKNLIEQISRDEQCRLLPPDGSARVCLEAGERIPVDLENFYSVAGGALLFPDEQFGFKVFGPNELLRANPVLLASSYDQNRDAYEKDRSHHWFLIAAGIKMDQLKISIDLSSERLGRCYDSFWDVHGTGNSKIVARSFSELLELLYQSKGRSIHWDSDEFTRGVKQACDRSPSH
jgi:antitoxin YokJ